MPATVVEFLCGAYEADIALLDQIQKRNAAPHVLLGHADHQTRVSGDEVLPCRPSILNEQPEICAVSFPPGHRLARIPTALNSLGQRYFLLGGQQRYASNFLEIEAHAVIGIDLGQVVFVLLP